MTGPYNKVWSLNKSYFVAAPYHDSFTGISVFNKQDQNYSVGQTINFGGILYNDGGHFDTTLNRFFCPVNGIYFVSVNFKRLGTEPLRWVNWLIMRYSL